MYTIIGNAYMAEVEVLGLHLLLHANRIQIRRPPVGDQHERHIKRRKRVSSSLTDLLGEVRFQRKALKSHLIIAIDYFVATHHCKIFRLQ